MNPITQSIQTDAAVKYSTAVVQSTEKEIKNKNKEFDKPATSTKDEEVSRQDKVDTDNNVERSRDILDTMKSILDFKRDKETGQNVMTIKDEDGRMLGHRIMKKLLNMTLLR
jgi:uncharacterized FlaG/YvyC family protein